MEKNIQGKVLKLFIAKSATPKMRVAVKSIDADENGVLHDKFYNKNIQRAILITSLQSYEIAKKNSIALTEGALGENILIDINPYHLHVGKILHIGNATLRITQNCTLCKGLSIIDSKLPKLLEKDRGVFAEVIGGTATIHINDTVSIPSYE